MKRDGGALSVGKESAMVYTHTYMRTFVSLSVISKARIKR